MLIEYYPRLDFENVLIVPKKTTVRSRADVDLFDNDINDLFPGAIPIIAANMDTVGCFSVCNALSSLGLMTCLHKHYTAQQYIDFFRFADMSKIFYSIGVTKNDFSKLKAVYEATGVKNICLDVANAYIPQVQDIIKDVKNIIPESILMVGNIATPEILEDFAKAGVDIAKAGIGNGNFCRTQSVAGVGVPQFSCILDCISEAKRLGIRICSDGGCSVPGDVAKSFAAGASMVMLGSMFIGADECEGEWEEEYAWKWEPEMVPSLSSMFTKRKTFLKAYGMSSQEAMEKYSGEVAEYRASEGVCKRVPYKGFIKDIASQILGGLRSACSYTNAHTLRELKDKATFVHCNRQRVITH